ncbi:MAG: hypothetical protein JNJ45_02520 [Chthonomonas sp.]|nr:hypothetical protein [Chthonomonas sp.]
MPFTNIAYSALLVAAGAVGLHLVDDATPVQAKTPPKVEVQKSAAKDVEVYVNGQRIQVKAGEPLEIKIKSNGKERIMKVHVDADGMSNSWEMPDMKSLHKHFEDLKFDFKDLSELKELEGFKDFDLKVLPRFSPEDSEKMMKEMEKFHIEMKDIKPDMEKMKIELKKIKPEIEKGMRKWQTNSHKDLIASLTPEQRAKMKSQGYLRASDLTPSQRAKVPTDGDWTISINTDGEKFEFRSK